MIEKQVISLQKLSFSHFFNDLYVKVILFYQLQ